MTPARSSRCAHITVELQARPRAPGAVAGQVARQHGHEHELLPQCRAAWRVETEPVRLSLTVELQARQAAPL